MIIQLVIVLSQPVPVDAGARIRAIIENAALGEWSAEVDLAGAQTQMWFDVKVRAGIDPASGALSQWQALLNSQGVGDWAKVMVPKKVARRDRRNSPAAVSNQVAKNPRSTTTVPSQERWVKVPIPTDSYRFDLFALPSGDLIGCDGGSCWRMRRGEAWAKELALRTVRAVAVGATEVWAAGAKLQRSNDGGNTWQEVEIPRPHNFRAPAVTALTVVGSEVILGIGEGSATYNDSESYQFFLYRSVNGGRDFVQLHKASHEIRSIVRVGETILFVAGQVFGWRPDGTVHTVERVHGTTLAHHAGVIFAGGAADLYLSSDNGRSFQKASSGVSARSETGDQLSGTASGFNTFVAGADALYAASTLGVLRVSADGVAPIAWGLHSDITGLALAHGFLYAHSGGKLWRAALR